MKDLSAQEQEKIEDEAKSLNISDIKELEHKLEAEPDDTSCRFKILMAYEALRSSMPSKELEFAHLRIKHVLWFVDNLPAGTIFVNFAFVFIDDDGFRARVKSSWIKQINKSSKNTRILQNAYINLLPGAPSEKLMKMIEAQINSNEFDPGYNEYFSIPTRCYTGLKISVLTSNPDYRISNSSASQICVYDVIEGGPAQMAGIQKNDLIESVNETQVQSFEDFLQVIKKQDPELEMNLVIIRNQKPLKMRLLPFVQEDIEGDHQGFH